MENFRNYIESLDDYKKYLYIRGFLLTDRDDIDTQAFPFYGNWNKIPVGDCYTAYTHYLQNVYTFDNGNLVFFLFGHAYNPFTMVYDETEILKCIAESYGTDDFYDRIDEITGVFVMGFVCGKDVTFIVDPSGMQSASYSAYDNHFYITSHSQIIGDLCSLKMSAIAEELINYKWYYRVMGPYMPADLTQFDEVKRIVPDIEYFYKSGNISHERFYPVKKLTEVKDAKEYNAVIEQAADILKNSMELVVKKWDMPSISLSGGIDSNTTFAAANGLYDKIRSFSFISAEKESIDAVAAEKIAGRFNVDWKLYEIPNNNDELDNFEPIKRIIDHNNGYIARGRDNEYRKRAFLVKNLDTDVEIKSWASETIRAYWYKYYGRKSMPKLSPKLFRNLYKIFIFNRPLAHKIDKIFAEYIKEFEYYDIPDGYLPADMHYNEVGWGSWGGLNISEMKIYADIVIIYNNRKFFDLLFRVPLEKRI